MKALWIAKTGLDAQQTRMATVSNNLANVNTTGFKRGRAVFEDLVYQNIRQAGGQQSQSTEMPSGLYLGTGARVVATEKMFTQGSLVQTENAFDMAIQGRGFFQVLMPDGSQAYSRDGSFQIDSNGQLVTASGYQVQPAINIPNNAQSVTVGVDGTVTVQLPGQAAPVQIGSVQTADFVNPGGLEPRGENLFIETGASGPALTGTPGVNGLGTLIQGMVEGSNVNTVEELVNMIETQRAFELNSRSIRTSDEMLQFITNNL
ncbi:flagellar basal-body rod protein FlgG [Kineobactrum sediminis]|uniref:Flagellar basal-body rod protein FlgG n=1 Tax=Kineobactrum sediminis TaxID=1905677 RepID=A0A2N5Y6J8_9GAMM|nr:flagellar basal-body rod protein FlgG [Kineobactrum sediminis]PLW83989.1 flagellar basal-body rod protein FlgG [Kineobactrum sediminis]